MLRASATNWQERPFRSNLPIKSIFYSSNFRSAQPVAQFSPSAQTVKNIVNADIFFPDVCMSPGPIKTETAPAPRASPVLAQTGAQRYVQ